MNEINYMGIAAVIGAFTGLLGAVFAGIAMLRSGRVEIKQEAIELKTDESLATSKSNAKKIDDVAVKVDGMTSELVAVTKDAEFAKGKLSERDAERTYVAELPVKAVPVVNGIKEEPLKVEIVAHPVPVTVIEDKK